MQIVQGSLVIIGANTPAPVVLFNGNKVPAVTGIRVDWENDEQRVKLRVTGLDPIYDELVAAGIQVKNVGGA